MNLLALMAAIVIGSVSGSFINVLASRGPRAWGLSEENGPSGLAWPPSQCEVCGRHLSPLELVPVASYLALRGRCRGCGAQIGQRHLLVEIAGGAIGGIVVLTWGLSIAGALFALFLFFLLALAVIDAETGYLPDALTFPALAAGLAAAWWLPTPTPAESAAGALAGGGGLWLIAETYRRMRGRDGLGGGDVKLFAAIGAWLGPSALPFVLLAASGSGLLVVGLGSLSTRSRLRLDSDVRFGPYLAAGAALALLLRPVLPLA